MKTLILSLFFISLSCVKGNDTLLNNRERINAFGLKLNFLLTKHSADFSQLSESPGCCPKYTDANGSGFEFSLLYQEYLSKSISFSPSFGILSTDALFLSNEEKKIIIDNNSETAVIEHHLMTNLYFLFIETNLIFNLISNLNFLTALSLDYLIDGNFEQKELLIKPENRGTFENGKRTRNENNGRINNINKFNFFLKAGICYEFPLNRLKSITALPEVSISIGLNNLLPENKWKFINFSIGLKVLFNNYLDYSTPIEPKHRN